MKHIQLSAEQHAAIRELARRYHTSESAVIRELVAAALRLLERGND